MEINELQKRLWADMLKAMVGYRKGELSYSNFINKLEGAWQAGEYKENELIEKWFDLWCPFEILSATKGDSTTIEDVDKYLLEMELFLKSKSDYCFDEEE
jgi:hypothetical protein